MRAFKQFLSLVLVTCMLTSMFAIVSAAGPQVYAQTWDSDSGHVTIAQGENEPVDSGYTRIQDSGTVSVVPDGEISIDLANKENVQVTVTGAHLSGQYDLYVSVKDSGVSTQSFAASAEPVTNTSEDKESDDLMIQFEVPALMMAGGSALEIYGENVTDKPLWEISYKTNVTKPEENFATEASPAEVEPVVNEEQQSASVPAAAVAGVLSNLSEEAASASIQISPSAGTQSLLLDTSIFDNDKFKKPDFVLNITVAYENGNTYTWTFTSKNTNLISLYAAKAGNGTEMDLVSTITDPASFTEKKYTGIQVEVMPDQIPSDKVTSTLKFTTKTLDGEANVFYRDADGLWVEDLENANCVISEGEVSLQVSKKASTYAIVDSGVTADMMNGTETPPEPGQTQYEVKVVSPADSTLELTKDKDTDTIQIQVVSVDEGKALNSANYRVEWKSNEEKVAKILDSNYQAASVQAVGDGETTVVATVVLNSEVEDVQLSTDKVEVTVKVSGFETTPTEPVYTVKINPESATVRVYDSVPLAVEVYEDGKVLDSGYQVKWEVTEGPDFIAVNQNGEVTGRAKGEGTVTATVTIDGKVVGSAAAHITATQDSVDIQIDKPDWSIKVNQILTIKAKVTGTDLPIEWKILGGDESAIEIVSTTATSITIKGIHAGKVKISGSIIGVARNMIITVEDGSSPINPGGSSSGGGNSGTAMPNTGSGAITTPGTGTTTPGTGSTSGNAQPQGCVSDTVGNFSINGAYQYKLTSTNGTAPVVTVSNSNFRVVLASQNGNDYFYKVYAIGAPGQTCDVYVNGTKVSTVTASSVYGGVMSDTTAPFTVKKGGSYQFKLTASSQPTMAAGSSSFRVEYVGNNGNDWFFKVYATGNAGDGCGFYVNGAPFTVAVAHIAE